MRITIVTGPFMPLPPAPCGAVEYIWHGLAAEFVKKGHHVTFLCRSHPSQVSDETTNGIRYIRRLHLRRTSNIYVDLLKDLLYATKMTTLLPRADICVTNTFWLPVLASRFRRSIGKIVVAVHRYPKNQMGLYRNCDRLAAVSNAVRDAIVQQTPNVAHLVNVIHNPINTEVFKPPQERRSANGEQTIIYTGRVHPEKGIHILIDAFRMLCSVFPNLRLRIVGPVTKRAGGGGKNYVAKLKTRANGLPVVFSGAVNDPVKLAEVLQEAAYYCYPSVAPKGEASPVAPLEAMATGLVPAVSRLEPFNEYIEDGSNGYFFDHNAGCPHKALADVLMKLITDTNKTKQMSAQAVKKASEFNYKSIAELYLDDWEGLLST